MPNGTDIGCSLGRSLGRELDLALAIQATERIRRSAVEERAALFARIAPGEAVDPAALAAATEAVAAAEGRTAVLQDALRDAEAEAKRALAAGAAC